LNHGVAFQKSLWQAQRQLLGFLIAPVFRFPLFSGEVLSIFRTALYLLFIYSLSCRLSRRVILYFLSRSAISFYYFSLSYRAVSSGYFYIFCPARLSRFIIFSLYFFFSVGKNGRTHAYRRLRWLCGLGLAAVGVECIVRRFIYDVD
jgi:hypothetical protein